MVIGYSYLVGDILHKAHILYLKNCKALCDKLICGVLTDKAVMEKKPKPILSFEDRLELIKAVKYVDVVIPQETYLATNNCNLIKPDILFENIGREEQSQNPGGKVIGDVWQINALAQNDKTERVGYQTQKPLELTNRIVNIMSNKNDLCFDPFCGSGTFPFSAKSLDRRYLGCDISDNAIQKCYERGLKIYNER